MAEAENEEIKAELHQKLIDLEENDEIDSDESEDEIKKEILEKEELEQKYQQEKEQEEQQRIHHEQQEKLRLKHEAEKLEKIRQQERDLLDTRSQPIRQYLMDNVVPQLTQGLIDVCKSAPDEPLEFLAEYLLKKADELDERRAKERQQEIEAKLNKRRL